MSDDLAELEGRARATCAKALDALNGCIERLIEAIDAPPTDPDGNVMTDKDGNPLPPDYDKDAVVHLAWLTQQVIEMIGKIRTLPRPRGVKGEHLEDMFK